MLVAAGFYFMDLNQSMFKFNSESKRLALEIAERMRATVAEVAKTDPQAAARIAEAQSKALQASSAADRDAKSWLDKLFGGFSGAAIGGGFLLFLALAYGMGRRK